MAYTHGGGYAPSALSSFTGGYSGHNGHGGSGARSSLSPPAPAAASGSTSPHGYGYSYSGKSSSGSTHTLQPGTGFSSPPAVVSPRAAYSHYFTNQNDGSASAGISSFNSAQSTYRNPATIYEGEHKYSTPHSSTSPSYAEQQQQQQQHQHRYPPPHRPRSPPHRNAMSSPTSPHAINRAYAASVVPAPAAGTAAAAASAPGQRPYSLLSSSARTASDRPRAKASMADAVEQALNAHPYAVSGFLVMNQFAQKRATMDAQRGGGAAAGGPDGSGAFAFSRPAPSGASLLAQSSAAMARVMARAQDIKRHSHASGPASAPSGEALHYRHGHQSYPGTYGVADNHPRSFLSSSSSYSPPRQHQPHSYNSHSHRSSTSLRDAGAKALGMGSGAGTGMFAFSPRSANGNGNGNSDASATYSHPVAGGYSSFSAPPLSLISAPPKPLNQHHQQQQPKPAPQSTQQLVSPPRQEYGSLSPSAAAAGGEQATARRMRAEAEAAAAAAEADRRRAERRHKEEAEERAYAHEVALRAAARSRRDLEDQARAEAARAFQRGVAEGAETARRRAEEQEALRVRRALLEAPSVSAAPSPRAAASAYPAATAAAFSSDTALTLAERRRQRAEAAAAAEAEVEAELARRREERRRRAEEEDRAAEEAARAKREERRRKTEEDAAEDSRRAAAAAAAAAAQPSFAAPTLLSQARSAAVAEQNAAAAQEREERRRRAEAADAARAAAADAALAQEQQRRREERARLEAAERAAEDAAAEKRRAARAAELDLEFATTTAAAAAATAAASTAAKALAASAAAATVVTAALEKKMAAEEEERKAAAASAAAASAAAAAAAEEETRRKKELEEAERTRASKQRLESLLPPPPPDDDEQQTLGSSLGTARLVTGAVDLPVPMQSPPQQEQQTVSIVISTAAADAPSATNTSAEPQTQAQSSTPAPALSDATRAEMRGVVAALAEPTSTLLPRQQATGLVAGLSEREVLLLLEAGRPRAEGALPAGTGAATAPSRTVELLATLQHHPSGALAYLSPSDLARDVAEVREGRAPTWGVRLPASAGAPAADGAADPSGAAGATKPLSLSLWAHQNRVAASWIVAGDRDALFDYLASGTGSALFAANVKLSNRTLDLLLTQGGGVEGVSAGVAALVKAGVQCASAAELVEALRAERLYRGGNAWGGWAVSERTMRALMPAGPPPQPPGALPFDQAASPPGPGSAAASPAAGAQHSKPASRGTAGQQQAAVPAWITASDRDRLFDYLASGECALFSANVKLSNRTLNLLLAEGGSAEGALRACKALNAAGKQYPSATALLGAIKQVNSEAAAAAAAAAGARGHTLTTPGTPGPSSSRGLAGVASPRTGVKSSLASAEALIPNPVAPSSLPLPLTLSASLGSPAPLILPPGVAPPPVRAAWITERDRDALFAYFAHADCQLFTRDVSLNNKTLDAFLTEGGSLAETLGYLRQIDEAGNQYASAMGLLEAVKLVRVRREAEIREAITARAAMSERNAAVAAASAASAAAVASAANAAAAAATAAATERKQDGENKEESKDTAAAAAAAAPATAPASVDPPKAAFVARTAAWISPSDRDALFDYLASADCLLFAVNVKLSNKALDSLLVAGGSTSAAIELASALNAAARQFHTVGELVDAIEEEKKIREGAAPGAPAAATTEAADQPVAAATVDAVAVSIAASAEAVAAAAPVPAAAPANPAADRDTLFALLADPDCQLFAQDVKLNNRALDRLLSAAGGSCALACMYAREFHASGLQFSSVDLLCEAVAATHQAAAEHKRALYQFLQEHQAHLFTAEALAGVELLTQAGVDELYRAGCAGLYTLSHVERVRSLGERSPSLASLAAKVARVDVEMNAQHQADASAVSAFFHTPPGQALLVLPAGGELSPVEAMHLAASGRQSLYAPSRSLEHMALLARRGLCYPTLPALMEALHAGISNPNTARDAPPAEEALTARNVLDAQNDYDHSEMAGVLKPDLAASALARVNASKGDAKAPATAVPVPHIPPLPREAEVRRHQSALGRIERDQAEDAARIAAHKTPRNALLVSQFRATSLPRVDALFGSCNAFLEVYRYRAYQDQVTAAVWEQMKNNLWQQVVRTEPVLDSLAPTWPTVVWPAETICSGELERPLLIKASHWNTKAREATYLGELVTTLRELLERAADGRPFELLNEGEAKKNPKSYQHSGLIYVSKAAVKIPRSVVAIRSIVSAIQSRVSLEAPRAGTALDSHRRSSSSGNAAAAEPPVQLVPSLTKHSGHLAGMGAGQYVYSECLVWFQVLAKGLDKMDVFGGKSDPLLEVHRVAPGIGLKDGQFAQAITPQDYVRVYASEVKEHTLEPQWRGFVLTMKELCTGNVLCPLIIRVCNHSQSGSHQLIGEFAVDLYTLLVKGPSGDAKYPLINPSKAGKSAYKNSGTLTCKVKLLSKYELTSRDPQLVEDLVCRAPFLLGWQPGLELKSLQRSKTHRSNKSGQGLASSSSKGSSRNRPSASPRSKKK